VTDPLVLHLHAAATLALVGLIWFVQVVHYPLFGRVGAEGFPQYATLHQRRTTWVVAPLMLIEAGTGLWLVVDSALPAWQPWTGLALLVAIWASTACLQVPLHGRLAAGFDPRAHRALVRTNWLRTAAWTARGALVLLMLRAN
jgi:hypothetical protein